MSAVPRELDVPLDRVSELGNELLQRLDALRTVEPIAWSEVNQLWIVTGHAEVMEGFSGSLPLSAQRHPSNSVMRIPQADRERLLPCIMNATRNWLLNKDGEDHLRLRKLLVRAFGKPIVEGVRPHARRFIREALDAAGRAGEIDFVRDVARPIPARTILHLLGLPDDLVAKLHGWSRSLNQIGNVNVDLDVLLGIEQTLRDLRDVFRPAFEARRRQPTDDFLSALVTASEGSDRLSEDEMFGTCDIVLIAGHDTTANTMALATALLAEHPEACGYLREHPEDAGTVALELARRVSMSTAMGRRVARDFNWRGRELKAGQFVLLFQGAANRDPGVFPDPDRLDFSRPQDQNMMFAPGAHHCIGHLLARMQLGEFFPELVRRFDFERLERRLDFGPTMVFRGLNTLPLRLRARH